MSLEAVIQENTEVMRELIARLSTSSLTAVQMTGKQLVDKVNADEKAATSKDTAKSEAKADTKADETAEGLNYEKEVRPALVKVSTAKGRDALVALLDKFGVTKGDQLKPSQLAKVLAAANELLAA
jgi:hypothetical protein